MIKYLSQIKMEKECTETAKRSPVWWKGRSGNALKELRSQTAECVIFGYEAADKNAVNLGGTTKSLSSYG